MSDIAPDFPLAAAALAPLRAKSEMAGSADFTPLWSGQAARLSRELFPAAELTQQLAAEALQKLRLLQTLASIRSGQLMTAFGFSKKTSTHSPRIHSSDGASSIILLGRLRV